MQRKKKKHKKKNTTIKSYKSFPGKVWHQVGGGWLLFVLCVGLIKAAPRMPSASTWASLVEQRGQVQSNGPGT